MKQSFFFLLLATICCLSSCSFLSPKKEEKEWMSDVGLMLQGEHKLRKLTESTGSNTKIHESFFIFGGTNIESTSSPIVSFAWEKDSSTYILSTLSFNKIRIKFVDKIETPTIKFRWACGRSGYTRGDDINRIMKVNVIYAVISIQKEDWPQEINLPMNISPNIRPLVVQP